MREKRSRVEGRSLFILPDRDVVLIFYKWSVFLWSGGGLNYWLGYDWPLTLAAHLDIVLGDAVMVQLVGQVRRAKVRGITRSV